MAASPALEPLRRSAGKRRPRAQSVQCSAQIRAEFGAKSRRDCAGRHLPSTAHFQRVARLSAAQRRIFPDARPEQCSQSVIQAALRRGDQLSPACVDDLRRGPVTRGFRRPAGTVASSRTSSATCASSPPDWPG